ncbi:MULTISPECIES: hypothetical protein [Rhizobium]|uniref:hypothetical protein n=1 Tax=Rhizobium TaxID=379 RepID=UPI00026ECBB2|nr:MULTISPECIES: hypothetical protein [Rhizobium]EJK87309.1 hypothetical protein PMI03_01320 [Rhizobium sp. AP16]MDJ1632198.1 hypothetical protein [Rhizobium rhizogenes]
MSALVFGGLESNGTSLSRYTVVYVSLKGKIATSAGPSGTTQLDSVRLLSNFNLTNSFDSRMTVSATTDFIAELVRAANEVEKLSPNEVSNMLDRSVSTIRELRQELGIVPVPGKDALIYIRTVSAGAARLPHEEWQHGLLHAAEMIRDLHIVHDTGTEFRISEIEL